MLPNGRFTFRFLSDIKNFVAPAGQEVIEVLGNTMKLLGADN